MSPKSLFILIFIQLLIVSQAAAQVFGSYVCQQIENKQAAELCSLFYQAVERGELIAPVEKSAFQLFARLADNEAAAPVSDLLRRDLVEALTRKPREAVDGLVELDPRGAIQRVHFDEAYRTLPEYLDKALTLVDTNEISYDSIAFQKLYLQGLAMRARDEQSSNPDANIVQRASQYQLEAMKYDPRSPFPYYEAGMLLCRISKFKQGNIYFEKALELDPGWPLPYYGLSRSLAKINDTIPAIRAAMELVEARPDQGYSHQTLAGIYARFGETRKSLNSFQEAAEAYLKATGSEKDKEFNAYALGSMLMEFELFSEAEPYLEMAAAGRQFYPYLLALGRLHYFSGRYLKADSILRICVEKWPEEAAAFYRLGTVYHDLGRYARARLYYEEAIAKDPGHQMAYLNLGLVYQSMDLKEKAVQALVKAVIYYQGLQEIFARIDTSVTVVRNRTGIYSSEFLAFLASVKLAPNPHDDFAYFSLGRLLLALDKPVEAEKMYISALLLNYDYPEAYRDIASINFDKSNYGRAALFCQLFDQLEYESSEFSSIREEIKGIYKKIIKIGRKHLIDEDDLDIYSLHLDATNRYFTNITNQVSETLDFEVFDKGRTRLPRVLRK